VTTAVVVGSGPNGLAAALTLATASIQVRVLEASESIGGGTRSSQLTLPGLLHDECSAFHPFAVDTPFSRKFNLTQDGLTWRWPEVQYAHPLTSGRGAAAWRSVLATSEELGSDGPAWESVFGPLTTGFDAITDDVLRPMLHLPEHPLHLARFGGLSALPASMLIRRWSSAEGRALFAGVAAHSLQPLTAPLSSAIGVALATAAHRYGWPVAEGGSSSIANALVRAITRIGGVLETGVRVQTLDELGSPDVVMLDVAPAAAARIVGARMPTRIARQLIRYRHGPGIFKVDFAIADGVPWKYEPSRFAGTVHVCGEWQEVAEAERLISAGRMADHPFVLVGQQYLADPCRSVGGIHPLYAYAHVPAGWTGDATGQIEAQIERFAPGFRDRILARHVRGVKQLEQHNINFVGGDVVTGANDIRQLVFRPRPARNPYSLGVPGVYLCSAATPPGAGAHGMCGYNAATTALRWLQRRLVLQQHFVVLCRSSLVVAGSGAVLMEAAPAGPGPGRGAAGDGGDQVCQETTDLAERDRDEAAARAVGAMAAVRDR